MSRLGQFIPRIRTGVAAAFGRFPWMLLCGLSGTIAAIVATEYDHDGNRNIEGQCARVIMTVALGMPLFFSLRMLRERSGSLVRWPIEIVGLPLLAAYYFRLPAYPFDGPGIIGIHWALLFAALHFLAAVAPFVHDSERIGFWHFNRRLFLRFCLTTLYSAVLTGGLELALVSADKLFGLHLDKSYGYLFFFMVGCFHPAFFLAGVPRDFVALDADPEYPRGLKAFTQFALAPLVAVYTGILYAYAVKIVLAWTWPHGWVALPVLILSGVGIFAALLLHPLRTRPEEKWAVWYYRVFPGALAPLSVLLLLSVRERILSYGVTEDRYLGIVVGSWILAWALVFTFRKSAGLRWIPASLAVICLAAAFGPQSAGAISKASQLRRLEGMLRGRGLLVGGEAQPSVTHQDLPQKEYDEIESTIRYLITLHGGQTVQGLFGTLLQYTDWKDLSTWQTAEEILKKLKLSTSGNIDNSPISYTLDETAGVSLEGFRRVWYVGFIGTNNFRKFDDVTIRLDDGALLVSVHDEKPVRPVPIDSFLKSLPARGGGLPPDKLTVDWNQNGRNFRIVFTSLAVRPNADGQPGIEFDSFLLLER